MNSEFVRLVKRLLPYILPVVVLAAAVIYFLNNRDQFRQIRIASWWWLWILFLGCFSQSFFSALVFKRLLKIFDIGLGFWESLGLVYVTGMGNFLVPYVGGIGLRAAYLKKRYGFPLDYFASTVGGVALLSISINALIGLLVVLYLLAVRATLSPIIFLIFLFCLMVPVALILLPARRFNPQNRLLDKINRVWEGWKIISRQGGDVAVLSGYILLTAISGVLILYCSFRVVSDTISLADAAVISAMTSLSALVNITPSGLGISELAVVFTSKALGYITVISISGALIRRAVSSILLFGGGMISSHALSKVAFHSAGETKSTDESSGVRGAT